MSDILSSEDEDDAVNTEISSDDEKEWKDGHERTE